MSVGMETERKFIIRLPEIALLEEQTGYTRSDIVQTYFDSEQGLTHRVRKRTGKNGTVYTETKKRRVSRLSSIEDEIEIGEEEYLARLATLKILGSPLHKTRHTFAYGTHTFEVDIYAQWKEHAVMEVEFAREDETIALPPFIEIVKEATGTKEYSNFSMAIAFPSERFD